MSFGVNFVFYGKLKSTGSLNFLLPKKRAKKENLLLPGYKVYKTGNSFVAIKAGREHKLEAEFWEFRIKAFWSGLLLFFLDLLEGVFWNKYKRHIIETEYGKAWIYLGGK